MRLLLDTHAIIWAIDEPSRLTPRATAEIQDPNNELFVSAATIWEIAIKTGTGKLSLSGPYRDWMNRSIADLALSELPITVDYADVQATLPFHHRDPFDRLMIAHAMVEQLTIVSADVAFDPYGVTRLW